MSHQPSALPPSLSGALLDVAARNSSRTAVVDGKRTVSYAELAATAGRLAARLGGLTGREHVGLCLPTSAGFKAALLGVLASGRAAVPLNYFLAHPELAAVIDHAELDLVLACRELAGRLPAGGARTVLLEELLASGAPDAPAAPGGSPASGDDLAVLLYTSGSTGRPKGVRLSHRNLLHNATASARAVGFGPDDVVLAALPSFHAFALTTTVLAPLLSGAAVITLPHFHPEAVLDAVERGGASVLLGVPGMYRLMSRAQRHRARDLARLRLAVSGGEKLPAKVRDEFAAAFGRKLHEGYGLTECSPVVALNRPVDNRPGTVGRPLEGLEVRIAGADGAELPSGADGEVQVRGDSVMCGYHRDEPATRAVVDPDGWLRTGDLGRVDADGYLSITGRLKELIIVGGENVMPGEVEAVLAEHPAVAECAVLGAADEGRGEQVAALVVLRSGAQAPEPELKAHCRGRLAAYKVPRRMRQVAELPKLPTGKVDRRALAALLAGGEP